MPKAARIKREKGYLPRVPLPVPEEMQGREKPGKSRDRLQAAVLRKRGGKIRWIAKIAGARYKHRLQAAAPDGTRGPGGQARQQEPGQARSAPDDGGPTTVGRHTVPAERGVDVSPPVKIRSRLSYRNGWEFRANLQLLTQP